jgi:hypothetical protein
MWLKRHEGYAKKYFKKRGHMKVPRYIKKWTHEGPKVLKKYMMST